MVLPEHIQTALKSELKDMLHWSILIDFFAIHKQELSYWQKRKIYNKAEAYRQHYNNPRQFKQTIVRPSGDLMEVTNVKDSLDIAKADIQPNDIYQDNSFLDNPFNYYSNKFFSCISKQVSSIVKQSQEG